MDAGHHAPEHELGQDPPGHAARRGSHELQRAGGDEAPLLDGAHEALEARVRDEEVRPAEHGAPRVRHGTVGGVPLAPSGLRVAS